MDHSGICSATESVCYGEERVSGPTPTYGHELCFMTNLGI